MQYQKSPDAVFTLDIWDNVIDYIPDYPRDPLKNLACANKELCILLRRRFFNQAIVTITRNSKNPSQQAESCWSKGHKLLTVIQSRPAIAECVKHLVIRVFETQSFGPSNRVWYYDDFSISRLVPYLTKLRTLSFESIPYSKRIAWSSLPEPVRRAVHPLLHQVSDLRFEYLTGAFAASTRQGGLSALESLTVTTSGTFEVGDSFPNKILSVQAIAQGPQPHRLKSLIIDKRTFPYSGFADWLTIDNPAFPITINSLESLVVVATQYHEFADPHHGSYHVFKRCARSLKRLELLVIYHYSAQNISVNVYVYKGENQWKPYPRECLDLSCFVSLTYLRLGGLIIASRSPNYAGQIAFSTSVPYITKVLQSLPNHPDKQPTLRHIQLDCDIHEFDSETMKLVDWSVFSGLILDDPRFSNVRHMFIDITYVYNATPGSNTDRIERSRPPRAVLKALRENVDLMRLKVERGLVLGSTNTTKHPRDFMYDDY
ncbi:hypothetical protein BJ165DRAFT_1612218 [Panaeolus papilionaceus]|nr:hypothetical protein BJ165DRAFT_1612218 [Panaeolus papilionaceus]